MAALVAAVLCLLATSTASAKRDPFEVITRPSKGRTLAAELVDLNGDGRSDLLQIVSTAPPPNENRLIYVYLQGEGGELPAEPSFERPLPPGAAAYDLADLTEQPGIELVLLNQTGVEIMSVASATAPSRQYEVGATTAGPGSDERGLERLQLVFENPGQATWIAVPTFNGPVVLDTKGEVLGRLNSPGRANYFIPQKHGLAFLESDIQIYFDVPHLSIGDVNGDGRADLVTATRHALRVFHQTPDGRLPREASQTLELDLISDRDHIRGSGGVVGQTADIDGDGKLDLLLSHVGGTFSESAVQTRIHLNRNGSWDLTQPDREYRSEGAIGSDTLMDLDGDGRPELIRATIKMSVLELVEVLITRALDVELAIFRGSPGEPAEVLSQRAFASFKIEIPLNFDSLRAAGFVPNIKADVNGDGYRDLLRSGRGDGLSLYLGGPDNDFKRRTAKQKLDTRGQMSHGDWNGDGLSDLLLFAPKTAGVDLRLLISRGTSN